jgi:hypothetical protein
MRVIVCGGRMFGEVPVDTPRHLRGEALLKAEREKSVVFSVLESAKPTVVAQGGAKGADSAARDWCAMTHTPCETHAAHWAELKRAAGPIRNQTMLDEFKPDKVIAFPGGRGTADMVRRAKAAGVPVMEVQQ